MKMGRYLSQVFVIAIAAFNLGRYSVQFSGDSLAWAAVVLSLIVVVAGVVALIGYIRAEA
jgi:hypothetical protein